MTTEPASRRKPLIRITGLRKSYVLGDVTVHALRGVDVEIASGTFVTVVGASGSGKSTFMNILGLLDRPSGGQYFLEGEDVSGFDRDRRAVLRNRKIGFVFQNFNLLESLTATENVTLVMSHARGGSPHRARELLHMLGLDHRLKSLPKNLSGGEKQRVAIARALANNPDLILADEPTANIDAKRGREVMLLLRQIAVEMDKAVVVVTHDHRVREIATRIVWLEDGTFRADVITARDPVCSRVIEVAGAPALQYEVRAYYFCSDACRHVFEGDPTRFAQM